MKNYKKKRGERYYEVNGDPSLKNTHQSLRRKFLEVETTANALPQLNQNIPSGKERLISFFYWK